MMRPAMEAYSRLYKGLGQRFSLYFLFFVLFGKKIHEKNLTKKS